MPARSLAAVVLFLAICGSDGYGQAPDRLVGCWEIRRGDRRVVERWERRPDGGLNGDSRIWVGGRAAGGEQLVLARDSTGTWLYHADPDTQSPASFRATIMTDTLLVFENPQHDYPQRIGYRPRGDSLYAWIEAITPGQRRVSFPFARIGCSGTP